MDLHPEDLIEREALGEISPAERERLDLHTRQCAVCRIERQARDDFRTEAEGPEADADIARLLDSMAAPLAMHMQQRASRRSPMRYLRFVAAAAAVISVTGFAAAAGWSGVRAVILPWSAPAPVAAVAPTTTPAVAPHKTPARVVATVQTPVKDDDLSAATPPLPVAPAPVEVTPVRTVVATSVRRAVAKAPPPDAPPPPAPVVSDDPSSNAGLAFRLANEARQAGDHLRAGELYGMLLNRFAGTPEAHASLALFGRMLLDDGNANGALQCFDDYLRNGGTLREDVMLGRALAFQRIGPRAASDEARAWSALLDAYPGTVHTARARRRLLELQGS
jgi:hypothetical protein